LSPTPRRPRPEILPTPALAASPTSSSPVTATHTANRSHGQESQGSFDPRPPDLHGHDRLLLHVQAPSNVANDGHAEIRPDCSQKGSLPRDEKTIKIEAPGCRAHEYECRTSLQAFKPQWSLRWVAGSVCVQCINMMGISGVGELALRSCAAGRNPHPPCTLEIYFSRSREIKLSPKSHC
ncbi:Uncharacterized protein TPAR_08305, partial [Tolypocladium paradoxum]